MQVRAMHFAQTQMLLACQMTREQAKKADQTQMVFQMLKPGQKHLMKKMTMPQHQRKILLR